MENQEPYNCVQIIINIRGPWLQTVKRIILLAIYTVRVRLLRLVVERAVTLRGHHSVWVILKLGKNSAVGVAARIDKSALLIEASNFFTWSLETVGLPNVDGPWRSEYLCLRDERRSCKEYKTEGRNHREVVVGLFMQ